MGFAPKMVVVERRKIAFRQGQEVATLVGTGSKYAQCRL